MRATNNTHPGPLVLGAIIWLLLSSLALRLATAQPWLGLVFESAGSQIRVASSTEPETAVVGQHLQAIEAGNGQWLSLSSADLNPEPSYLPSYAQLDAFYRRQNDLANAQHRMLVRLRLDGGQVLTLQPSAIRPIMTLPPRFFVQLLFAAMALSTAGVTLSRRLHDRSARYFYATAIGYAIDVSVHAVYSSRELALPGMMFHTLVSINHICAIMLVSSCGAIVLLYFPRDLGRPHAGHGLLAATAALTLACELRAFKTLDAFRAGIYGPFMFTIYHAIVQWHRAHERPADRAMLRWLLIPYLLGSSLYVFVLLVPASEGWGPRASQSWGWAMVLIIYAGLAIGLTRFRLFYVNPANLELWALSGTLFLLCFIAMHIGAQLATSPAIWISLCVASLGYLPLRDWLWSRQPAQFADFGRVLPTILNEALAVRSAQEIEPRWINLLRALYQPVTIDCKHADTIAPALLREGEVMLIPGLAAGSSLRISSAFNGRALFTPEDVRLCTALTELFRRLLAYWHQREHGEHAERARLAAALEQNFVAELGAMRENNGNQELAGFFDTALAKLDALTRSLGDNSESLEPAAWKSELEQRCAAAGMRAHWQFDEDASLHALAPPERIHDLRAIFREAVTNAIRHSGGSQIRISGYVSGSILHMTIDDDGMAKAADLAGGAGMGTSNMRTRAARIGARIAFQIRPEGGLSIRIEVPLTHSGDYAAQVPM